MNLPSVMNGLTKVVGPTRALAIQAKSPQILLVVGITGVVASGVLACRATLKAQEVVEQHKVRIEYVHAACEIAEHSPREQDMYPDKQKQKDLVSAYTKTGVGMAKLYLPPLILGAGSIICIIGGHRVLMQRNMGLIAAYEILDKGFKSYRSRVREEYGDTKDYEFYHGLRAEEIVEIEKGANGKEKGVKKTIYHKDPSARHGLSRIFDESHIEWNKDPALNRFFLERQQNYANDKLRAHKFLMLNEVYRQLGFSESSVGGVLGWVIGEGCENYVDFGIDQAITDAQRRFINGDEPNVWLNFNVDGVVVDLIDKVQQLDQ